MTLTDPWPVNSNAADAKEIRLGLTSVFASDGVVPFSKPGDPGAMPDLVYATSTMVPQLRDFSVVVARTVSGDTAPDGYSFMRNVGSSGVPAVATAPATGSRIDTFVVRANDTVLGDQQVSPQVLIRQGQATTGTPVAPTLLAGDEEICQITVPAGVTGLNASGVVIRHTYKSARVVDGRQFVRSTGDVASPQAGQLVTIPYSNSEGRTYKFDGTAWRLWSRPASDYVPTLRTGGLNWGASGGITKCESTVTEGWVTVHFRARFSGTGVSWGSIFYSLEVPADPWAISDMYGAGIVIVNDANGGVYQAPVQIIADGSLSCFQILRQGADNGASASWASSQPFQPATGDTISGTFRYRAA